jgi:predicted phosphodiesterase
MLASFPLSVFFGGKTMQFCLVSDIHQDFGIWDWEVFQDIPSDMVMVVAGDIDNDIRATSRWIAECHKRFPKLIWVAGNHDFYNTGFHNTRLWDRELETQFPYPRTTQEIAEHYRRWSLSLGVHFLDKNTVTVDGMTFVGATGWHDFQAGVPYSKQQQVAAYLENMSDARYIPWDKTDKAREVEMSALGDAIYIENQLAAAREPVVVVTHHAPHALLLRQQPQNPLWTQLNGSFANTRMQEINKDRVRAWCFGHTHDRQDRVIDGCRYINNARGYPRENNNWRPEIITLDK